MLHLCSRKTYERRNAGVWQTKKMRIGSDAHFIAQVVHDLLDSGLDYLYRAAETRASVAIQHGVFAESISPRLKKGIFFSVKTNTLIYSVA